MKAQNFTAHISGNVSLLLNRIRHDLRQFPVQINRYFVISAGPVFRKRNISVCAIDGLFRHRLFENFYVLVAARINRGPNVAHSRRANSIELNHAVNAAVAGLKNAGDALGFAVDRIVSSNRTSYGQWCGWSGLCW